jgi:ribose-phosphate pyrophosphokinase
MSAILIGSRANPQLNELVSHKIGLPLAPCQLRQFPNTESQVIIDVSVRGKSVYVLTTGVAPVNDNLMEALMICKAVKTSNAKSVTLICANYPYARQDKKTRARECITASFIAQMIGIAGVNRVVTFDLHADQIQGMFSPLDISVDNIKTTHIFAEYLRGLFPLMSADTHIIVSPDAGAMKKNRNLAGELGLPIALIEKNRNYANGDKIESMVLIEMSQQENKTNQHSSVRGKIAIIYDDLADSLGTLLGACQVLENAGASGAIAVITHGPQLPLAIERLNGSKILTHLIQSNTMPPASIASDKIHVCDISGLIATTITCLENNESLSETKLY